MPKEKMSAEEARERKNARQREYAKRTGYEANKKYLNKAYVFYTVALRKDDDAELISIVEGKKAQGFSVSEIFRELVKK